MGNNAGDESEITRCGHSSSDFAMSCYDNLALLQFKGRISETRGSGSKEAGDKRVRQTDNFLGGALDLRPPVAALGKGTYW